MTDLASPASFTPAASAPHRVGGAFGVVRRLLGVFDAAGDRVQLHALSDHTLRDMGLLRDQIDDVLRGVVHPPSHRPGRRG